METNQTRPTPQYFVNGEGLDELSRSINSATTVDMYGNPVFAFHINGNTYLFSLAWYSLDGITPYHLGNIDTHMVAILAWTPLSPALTDILISYFARNNSFLIPEDDSYISAVNIAIMEEKRVLYDEDHSNLALVSVDSLFPDIQAALEGFEEEPVNSEEDKQLIELTTEVVKLYSYIESLDSTLAQLIEKMEDSSSSVSTQTSQDLTITITNSSEIDLDFWSYDPDLVESVEIDDGYHAYETWVDTMFAATVPLRGPGNMWMDPMDLYNFQSLPPDNPSDDSDQPDDPEQPEPQPFRGAYNTADFSDYLFM